MARKDTRGYMAKKLPPKANNNNEIPIKVEGWQWETSTVSSRLSWRHWLAFILLLAVALLFAFGFLIVAGVILIIAIVTNIFLFLLRKFV